MSFYNSSLHDYNSDILVNNNYMDIAFRNMVISCAPL